MPRDEVAGLDLTTPDPVAGLDIATPALVVDAGRMQRNIEVMAARAGAANMRLWPHAKTHKSAPIARAQLAAGADGLTVATMDEAEYFAAAGVRRLLVAYPLVGAWRERRLESLAVSTELRVVVENAQVWRAVRDVAARSGRAISVFWEIDTGANRLGTPAGSETVAALAACEPDSATPLLGLLSFPGHSYQARDDIELRAIADAEIDSLVGTADLLRDRGVEVDELSIGSTPTLRYLERQSERYRWQARPGVYVFNDATQVVLGAAALEDCALWILASVIGRPTPNRVILDAGSKALGSDRSSERLSGYGIVMGHPRLRIAGLYEQHAIVTSPERIDLVVGDRVAVVPNHACAAVNLHARVHVVDAGEVVETWTIGARGAG